MKSKDGILKIAAALCAVSVLAGCFVLRSVDFQQEAADYEMALGRSGEIGREVLENENSKKFSIVIIPENSSQLPAVTAPIVSPSRRKRNRNDDGRGRLTMGQISKIIYDNLDVSITKLGNFDVVPRTEMAAIANESRVQAVLNNQTVALPATTPRYLLIYNVMQFSFEPKNVQVVDQGKLSDETANAMAIKDPIQKAIALAGVKAKATVWVKRHFGFVKLKMTMYDTKNKKRVYAQTLSGYSTASEQTPGLNGLINEAAENVVRDFMAQFAADFCPVAAVMMTKGSGQIAMLNIGRSHGVLKGSEIEFIEYMNIGKTMRAIPFAVGEVFEIDNESCWVEVKNYQNVRVRKFSVARIKPTQSKSSQINSL